MQELRVHNQGKIKNQKYAVLHAMDLYSRFIKQQKPKYQIGLVLQWTHFVEIIIQQPRPTLLELP